MEVGLEQRRHSSGPMRRQDNVRTSDIGKNPCVNVSFVSYEAEILFVRPDVFRKCAAGAPSTVVLAG